MVSEVKESSSPHIRPTPNMAVSEFSVHRHYKDKSYWQGSGPSVVYSGTVCYIEKRTNPSERGMPLTLHWEETIFHFCDTLEMWSFREESSVQWNFHIQTHTLHTLRLVLPWGHPGTCPIAQYTAYPFRRPPYSQGTALQSLQHTLPSGTGIPKNVQHTQQCTKTTRDYKSASQHRRALYPRDTVRQIHR